MRDENNKRQGKLVYYIVCIVVLIVFVLTFLQVVVVKERTKKSVAGSYE